MRVLRIGCIAATLLIPAFKSGGASLPFQAAGHRSGLAARIVTAGGAQRTVRLDATGCTEAMCSRVFIRTKDETGAPVQTWLDTLAAIKDTSVTGALFVTKDGATRRLSFLTDFRVLYVSAPGGATEKLDLASIRSVEFLDVLR